MSLPAIAFFAFTCLMCVLIEIYAMWWRIDHLRDDHEAITRELADMWTLVGELIDASQPEPATTPQPVVGPDTQPSHALVIGGARVTGKPTPYPVKQAAAAKRHIDWVDEELKRFNFGGGQR